MMILAATETPRHGWGNTVAMLVAAVVIWAIWRADLYYRQRWGSDAVDHSPTEPAPLPAPETRRSGASRLTSHGETDEPYEIEIAPGVKVGYEPPGWRERAAHVFRTGHSMPRELPEEIVDDDEPVGPGDPLAYAYAFDDDAPVDEVPDDEPVEPPAVRITAEEYARRRLAEGHEKAAVVAALAEHYGTKRATAYRLIDRVQGGAPGSRAA
jgi:hypothetical protein